MKGEKQTGALQAVKNQKRVDRIALKSGQTYADIGTPDKNFNVSGFLPKKP